MRYINDLRLTFLVNCLLLMIGDGVLTRTFIFFKRNSDSYSDRCIEVASMICRPFWRRANANWLNEEHTATSSTIIFWSLNALYFQKFIGAPSWIN